MKFLESYLYFNFED